MTRFRPVLLATLGLLLAACQREDAAGGFELSGRMFIFNYRLSYATYMVTFSRTEVTPDIASVVAEFENPAGGHPLVVEQKVFPEQAKLAIESPHVECVHKGRPYQVSVRFMNGAGGEVQRLDTTVTSDVDQSVLAARPLVTGPAYQKNPAVFGPDGTADFSGKADCQQS